MTGVQRTFIVGDKWLYFKVYSGFKIADLLLTDVIAPVANQLLNKGVISKWFFIRYNDPELHLRVRFLLTNSGKMEEPIKMLNRSLQPYIQNNLVWKVQIDTYQREIERYGEDTMEHSESLFFYDSHYFAEILKSIRGDDAEEFRWMSVLVSVDALLNDFSYNLQQKIMFISMVKETFVREFGMENSRSQLSDKYRVHREKVEKLLEASDQKHQAFHAILAERSKMQQPIGSQIGQLTENEETLNRLLSSYTHMMINRWFRSKQRMHEAVVYDFLLKFYKSKSARTEKS